MVRSEWNWKQRLRERVRSVASVHAKIVSNPSGMTILEVLIAGSMMIMIFLALGEMTINTMRVARNVESQADESDLRLQTQVSLRDYTSCGEFIQFGSSLKPLKDMGFTEDSLDRISEKKVSVEGLQLQQRPEILKKGSAYGPRVRIESVDLAWDKNSRGNLMTSGTQVSARLEITTDRGDVLGGRLKKVSVPLTLVRESDASSSPIIGCYYGDAAAAGKSAYLIVSQKSEDGPDCEGATQEAIQECIDKLDEERGGTVFIKSGEYELSAASAGSAHSLKISRKNVRIIGENGTELQIKTQVGISADTQSGFSLENIALNMNRARAGGVAVQLGSEHHVLRKVRFLDDNQSDKSAVSVRANQVTVTDCDFEGFSRTTKGVISNVSPANANSSAVEGLRIENSRFSAGVASPAGKVVEIKARQGVTVKDLHFSENQLEGYFSGFRVYGSDGVIEHVKVQNNRVSVAWDAVAVRCLESPILPPTNIAQAAPPCAEMDRVLVQGNVITGKLERTGDLLTDILIALGTSVSSAISVEGRGKTTLVSGNLISCTGGGLLQGIAVEKAPRDQRTDPNVLINGNKIFDCMTGVNAAGAPTAISSNVIERSGEISQYSYGVVINEGSSVVENRIVRFERGVVVRKTKARFAYDGTQVSRNLILGNAGLFENGNQRAGDSLAATAILVEGVGEGSEWQVQWGVILVGNTWLFLRENVLDGFQEGIKVSNFQFRTIVAPLEALHWIDVTGTRWATQFIGNKPLLTRDRVTIDRGAVPRSLIFTDLGGGAYVEIYDLKDDPVTSDQPTRNLDWSRMQVNRLTLGRTPAASVSSSEGNVYYDCLWRSRSVLEGDINSPAIASCESDEYLISGGGICPPDAPLMKVNMANPFRSRFDWLIDCRNTDGSAKQVTPSFMLHCCKR